MNQILTYFAAVDTALSKVIKPIVIALSLLVAGAMVLGIVTRSVFNSPMFGLEEIILFSVMWLYMLGAALASRERSHLSADFVSVVFTDPSWRHRMHLLATCISLVMVCAFVIWSFNLLNWGLNMQQSTPVFQLPLYLSQSSLFCASVLFLFYTLRDLLNDIQALRGQPQQVDAEVNI